MNTLTKLRIEHNTIEFAHGSVDTMIQVHSIGEGTHPDIHDVFATPISGDALAAVKRLGLVVAHQTRTALSTL